MVDRIKKTLHKDTVKERFLIIGIGLVLFFLFLVVTYFVAREYLIQIDFDTTVKLQDNIPRRFDAPFSSFSLLGSFELTTLIFIGIVLAGIRKPRRLLMLIWFPLFHIVELFAKTVIDQVGPPFMFLRYTFGFHFPTTYVSSDFYSYPSGHVGRAFFLSGIFAFLVYKSKLSKPKKLIFYLLIAAIAGVMLISRIYLGEHWASDTIGGMLLGLSFALFAVAVW